MRPLGGEVNEAAAIGVPDPKWREMGRAVVVPKPGQAPTEAKLLAHRAAALAREGDRNGAPIAPARAHAAGAGDQGDFARETLRHP